MVRGQSLTMVTIALVLLSVGVALGSEDVDVSRCAADSAEPHCQSDNMGLLQSKLAVTIDDDMPSPSDDALETPRSQATPCQTANAEACAFPFKYKGIMYDSCTSADGDQPWCATGTDALGAMVGGSWGKCAGSCSVPAPEKCTTKSGLTYKAEACVFPFKYNGVMYNSCISKDSDRLWCATKADKTGAYSSWGDCGSCAAQAEPSSRIHVATNLAIVDELYTYGTPGAGEVLQDLSHANGCFPGMRSYTENVYKWWPTRVDFASVATTFNHARTGTLVLHWASGDSWHFTCPGKKSWPEGVLSPVSSILLHGLTMYQDRIQHNTASALDSAQRARVSLNAKMSKTVYAGGSPIHAVQDLTWIKNRMLTETPGWTLVAFHQISGYAGTLATDKDNIMLAQNPANLECVLAFSGTNSGVEFITSMSSSSTSFCGFYPVHKGFTEEIWSITHSTQYQTDVKPKLGKCSKVIVTGHSLGGALSEVFAACINSGRTNEDVYKQMIWTKDTAEKMSEI